MLYGDTEEFKRIIEEALKRRWNRTRQLAVVIHSYVTMVEYMGKALNEARGEGTPELYQDAYIVATNAALLIAALNKIDLDSDKNMYRQIFSQAKVRPPNFERDFMAASGLAESPREKREVVSASRRLVRWARMQVIRSFKADRSGFWELVREVRY